MAAALIHKAIGDQLTCVFVDHGLLRQDEATQVLDTFARNLGVRVVHVDAADEMYAALEGVADPEQKRRDHRASLRRRLPARIGAARGARQRRAVARAGHDLSRRHRVGGRQDEEGAHDQVAPQRRRLAGDAALKLLEPLRELFKDEVRELGLALGLPREMVFRHPFPGPGLGVRILGAVTRHHADLLRSADAIFIDELRQARDASGTSWYDLTAQAFAVFLPVRSVGVMGDGRTYEHVVALRAVQTTDFMTAHWAPLPYDLLAKVSSRIINEVRGINRVVYDISGKPPATIEWE